MAFTVSLMHLMMMCPIVYALSSLHATDRSRTWEEERAAVGDRADDFSLKCELQGSPRDPVFSMNGDYIIGGVFAIHFYVDKINHEYMKKPDPQKCTGRSVMRKC